MRTAKFWKRIQAHDMSQILQGMLLARDQRQFPGDYDSVDDNPQRVVYTVANGNSCSALT